MREREREQTWNFPNWGWSATNSSQHRGTAVVPESNSTHVLAALSHTKMSQAAEFQKNHDANIQGDSQCLKGRSVSSWELEDLSVVQ